MSFRLKTVLGIALIEALLLTILVVSGMNYLSSSNATQLKQRAATTAKLVATMTGDAVIAVDLATLDVLVEQTLQNPDLIYVRIRSSAGVPLSEGGDSEALSSEFIQDESVEQTSSDQRFDISSPITVAGSEFGRVELGLSTETLNTTFGQALKWMVSIALAEMLLVALLGLILGHYLTRQLIQLKQGAKQVANGDFGYQLPVNGRDELADTAGSFNSMSTALKRYAKIVEEARQKAEAGREFAETTLQDALDSMRDYILVVAGDHSVVWTNRAYRSVYCANDIPSTAAKAFVAEAAKNGETEEDFVKSRLSKLDSYQHHLRWETTLTDGSHLLVAQQPMSRGGAVVVQTDVSELYQALEKNKLLQKELVLRQKSEAIGTLAGGFAHEINTPVQIIADNAQFIADTINLVFAKLDHFLASSDLDQAKIGQELDSIDWPFIKDEIPHALADLTDGTARVRGLVSTFKQLAKPDSTALKFVDLGLMIIDVIESTRQHWQPFAKIRTELDPSVPLVACQEDRVSQVLVNLIENAAHAIEDHFETAHGLIVVSLEHADDYVKLTIEDNGCGICEGHLDRIFDPMFTTKAPGRGAGQGLAISHTIITQEHDGRIRVESNKNQGTLFTIFLPIKCELSKINHLEATKDLIK